MWRKITLAGVLEFLGCALVLIAMEFLARKQATVGFSLMAVSQVCWFLFAWRTRSFFLAAQSSVLLIQNIRTIIAWR